MANFHFDFNDHMQFWVNLIQNSTNHFMPLVGATISIARII